MKEDRLLMSPEEVKKLHLIHQVIEEVVSGKEAARIIGITERHVSRIKKTVEREGDKGIIHKLRGRQSNRAKPEGIKERAKNLCERKYKDFGPTLASEKLLELEGIEVNKETLRLWFKEDNIPYCERKPRRHRKWRERKKYFGEMIQMDGSHHDWFEGRGPWCVFMGYIDDATNKVYGSFHKYEGTLPAMESFKRYIKRRRLPVNVYLDRHTTYKSTKRQTIEEELNNREPLTQFSRALKELGVNLIHANSPQAKGRIERLFRTLQDRLVKEMRLRGISNIKEANRFLGHYLPKFNKRFNVKASKSGDLHRKIPEGIDIDAILCVKTESFLRNDFTIRYDKKIYQIFDHVNTRKVTVEQRINGKMLISYKRNLLKYKEVTNIPLKENQEVKLETKRIYVPTPKNHPWRNFKFGCYDSVVQI